MSALAARPDDFRVTGVDLRVTEASVLSPFPIQVAPYVQLLPLVEAGRYDVVIHQGAVTDTRVPAGRELDETNSLGVSRLAQACSHSGTRLIFASSASVYGAIASSHIAEVGDEVRRDVCSGPLNPYAASKLYAEAYLREAKALDFVGFRYTNVFGTRERRKGSMACILTQLIYQAHQGAELRVFRDTLMASRDFVPVTRVVEAVMRVVECPQLCSRQIYNLGSGVSLSFAEILQWLGCQFSGADLLVRLIENPVAANYQYRTAVRTNEVEAALSWRPMDSQDVLGAAEELAADIRTFGFC